MAKRIIVVLLIFLLLPLHTIQTRNRTILKNHTDLVLSEPLYFKNRTITKLNKTDVPFLSQLPVFRSIPFTKETCPAELTLVKKDKSKVTVYTVNEYRHEIKNGAYAATTADMTFEDTIFKKADVILKLLEDAQPAKRSYISDPYIGIMNFDLLPSSLLFAGITDDKNMELPIEENVNVSSLLKKETSILVEKNSNCVTFDTELYIFHLCEMARSDFNYDGVEDILISKGLRVARGTLGAVTYYILTRDDNHSMFRSIYYK